MNKQLRILFVFTLLFTVILSGCSNDEGEKTPTGDKKENGGVVDVPKTPTEGGNLRVGVLQLPTWNPLKWEESTPQYSVAERLVYRGLFTYGADQQLIPDLIKNYTIDSEEDKTVLRFSLDEQAKWHDGTPISFEDISFTLQTYLDPFYYGAWKQNLSYINGTSSFRSGRSDHISGITQAESGEIVLELSDATSSFYHALTAPILPAHQLKELDIEAIHKQLSDGKVVGNGPFQFVEQSNTEIKLTRAIPFADGGPYLDGISFQLFNGEVAALGTEPQYDLISIPPQMDQELVANYQLYDVTQNVYYYLGFNMIDEVVGKDGVRTAIAEAIDHQAIIDAVLFGHGTVVDRIIPNHSWIGESAADAKEPQIQSAQNRMASLGYSADKPVKITVHYQANNRFVEKLVDALSQQLSAIYIKVDKKPLNGEDYYAYLFSGKPTQAFIHAWPFSKDLGYWWKLYGSYHDVKDLGLNIFHYHNDTVDEYSKRLYTTHPTSNSQVGDANGVIKQLQADRPFIPLFAPNQSYLVSKKLHDQVINGDGLFIDSAKWWMEK